METGPLIRRAWDLSWKYKMLWIFGLFLEGFGTLQSSWQRAKGDGSPFADFINAEAMFPFFMLIGFLGLVFLIMSVISSGALVDAVNKLTRGGIFKWGSSFSVGVDFFWRMFGIYLLFFGSILAWMLILALPAILLFLLSTVIGVLSLLILVPVLLVGIFAIVTVFSLAERALVVRNVSIGDAIEEGYVLLKFQPWVCAKIFLVFILLYLMTGFLALMLIGVAAAPFIAMALTSGTGIIMALVIGLPLVLLIMLVLDGLFGTFYHSLYTLFYFELLEPAAAARGEVAGQPAM